MYGTMSGYDAGATYAPPDGADDFQLPSRHNPAEPPPSAEPPAPKGGLLHRVLLFSGETKPEERDRVKKQFADSGVVFWGCGSTCEFHSPDPAAVKEVRSLIADGCLQVAENPRKLSRWDPARKLHRRGDPPGLLAAASVSGACGETPTTRLPTRRPAS